MGILRVYIRMKNRFWDISYCVGFTFRRFRNAMAVSAVSLCFLYLHYFMKDHWTEKMVEGDTESARGVQLGTLPFASNKVLYKDRYRSKMITVSPMHPNIASAGFFSTGFDSKQSQQLSNYKSVKNMKSKAIGEHERPIDPLWLNDFTTDLPENLARTLQKILTRDFEGVIDASGQNHASRCKRGFFRLKGMTECEEWLKCPVIKNLPRGSTTGIGVGKIVQVSEWNGRDVAIVSLRTDRSKYKMFVNRVQHGVQNMLLVQPSPYAVQIVGFCKNGNNTVLVVENCKKGNFLNFYVSSEFRRLSTMEKFAIAIQMIASFDYLHRGMGLPRVHCDLHTVIQAFGQWVVSDDRRLFLSDLDELPIVDKKNNKFATCEREPFGKMEQPNFLAPESRYSQAESEKGLPLKPVDQNSDVWKFPDLFANIMAKSPAKRYFNTIEDYDVDYHFKDELSHLHDRCKVKNPTNRPSSKAALIEYLKLYERYMSGGGPT